MLSWQLTILGLGQLIQSINIHNGINIFFIYFNINILETVTRTCKHFGNLGNLPLLHIFYQPFKLKNNSLKNNQHLTTVLTIFNWLQNQYSGVIKLTKV